MSEKASVLRERMKDALELAREWGDVDGGHHKQWLVDQMVRALTGDGEGYRKWVADYEAGEEDESYEWDTGISP